MAKWEFVYWLFVWLRETRRFVFDWDRGNQRKNAAKHGVSTDEVETVFRLGLALPLGVQISPATTEQRLGIVGPDADGHMLQVAFTLREGRVRVISARPAHRKERRRYEEILREVAEDL